MADSFVIEEKQFSVKKTAFEGLDVLAGIDRGCSLTKVLYATPDEANEDAYTLNAILFANKDFELALDMMAGKQMVKLGDGNKLRITGTGCDKYRDMIKEKLGMDVSFIDEFATMGSGVHWLLTNCGIDEVCYKDSSEDLGDLSIYKEKTDNPQAAKLAEQWQVQQQQQEEEVDSHRDCFPCLYGLFGSGGGFMQLLPDGRCRLISGVSLSGKSFLGFAQLMLGTVNYDEILALAGKGNRGNVDNQGRDLLTPGVDTPYGRMPPSLPIFPFGKAVDKQLRKSDCSREDLAHSLVAAFASNLFNMMCTSAKLTGSTRIFLGGNLFRGALMRQEILKQQHYFNMHSLSIRFLATGHTGAVGAMIAGEDAAARVIFTDD